MRERGVAVFRGIPYAQPPVGALRFAGPAPVVGWSGAREALDDGPPPPQGGHRHWTRVAGPDGRLADGQCVDAARPGRRLPVMAWIQGGGYEFGMSGLPEYDGARLARDGGVVVVTLNYRVGIEGFALIEGPPANRGLLDQVAALEWVRDNIAALAAMLSRTHSSAATWSSRPRLAGAPSSCANPSMPDPVVERDHDDSALAREPSAVVLGQAGHPDLVAAALDPHHHRQPGARGGVR